MHGRRRSPLQGGWEAKRSGAHEKGRDLKTEGEDDCDPWIQTETAPGHMYQMDWGFINVLDTEGKAALCVDGGCSRTGTLRNASWTDSSTDPTASTSRGLRSEENTRSPLR